MATREKERLISFLFERDDVCLINLKFFRGDRDVVSEEELCKQVHSAFLQEKMGRAIVSDRFQEEADTVDIREFIGTL